MAFSRKSQESSLPGPIVALTTDYGLRDHYVAAVKGVILSVAPNVRIIDVTHEIEPHNVIHGAFVLRQVWPWFPPGTIHVVVVDPGVGTSRRIIVGKYAGRFLVAPDNGLVTFLHRDFQAEAMHTVEDPRYFVPPQLLGHAGGLSNTFHGRDIMAPVAAHLANGVEPRSFGRMTDHLEFLSIPYQAEPTVNGFRGEVIYVDCFGTLVTNVRAEQLRRDRAASAAWHVSVDETELGPLRATFADAPPGECLALIGSSGYLEIAVNRGRAVDRFGRTPVIEVR
jgi:S-adenosyl-L-methionine hydrolase (adenosine-forming)